MARWQAEENGILSFTEFVLMPASALKGGKKKFTADRSRDGLEPLVYTEAKIQEDYKNDVLTPRLLKPAATKALIELTAPIHKAFEESKEWQEIT
jgi:tyrosyl-tRNA synthetase